MPMIPNWRVHAWPIYRRRLLKSDRPILVGPFRSEVGFEALYWIPFLHKLVADGVAIERLVPISRGGAAAWYGTPTGLELYAMRTPQAVRVENRIQARRTGLLKQTSRTVFDDTVLDDAAETMGLDHPFRLDPSWMYQTLAPYWEGRQGLAWIGQRCVWPVLTPPALPDTVKLPEEFVAVRFYTRSTFGSQPLSGPLVKAAIEKIASSVPVVLLHSDLHADDHVDYVLPEMKNVIKLRDLITLRPENNLLVQSAVLARASAFVGTYGGFAQLALRFGRSVVCFYDQWGGTALAHKHLSDAIALQLGVPFTVLNLQEIGVLARVLPNVLFKKPQPSTSGSFLPSSLHQPEETSVG